jgi:membrane protease YdiL (CAAX protease family)
MRSVASWVKKNPLAAFMIQAYVLSWVVEIPLALRAQGIIRTQIPFALHYLAGYGPMLSALIVTQVVDGSAGLRELWGRMIKWRVGFPFWLFAVSPLGVYLSLVVFSSLFWKGQVDFASLGQVDFLPFLGWFVLPMWILTFGFGEETGWRGFALPRLQKGRSALSATLILWLFWALWHLPMFFYSYDVDIIPGMLVGLLAGAINLTWLFNSTSGSILMVALWHGTFNLVTACNHCKSGLPAMVISMLVMIWAVMVVIAFKPARLSRTSKIEV